MELAPASLLSRIDPQRAAGSLRVDSDGILDLLPRADASADRSRRSYSAHPFDHHDVAHDVGAFERGLSPLARRLSAELPHRGLVLEAGCGAGHMTLWLRSQGIPVVGLDQSLPSLRILCGRAGSPAIAGDVTALPFVDGAFEAVLADGVIHHTVHPARALRELVRVLRPGGVLFVRVYRAEGAYPSIYRMVGGLLRAFARLDRVGWFVWRCAFPAYRWAATNRYRRRGIESGRHDEGVFSDYFLTPRATPARGGTLFAVLRRLGLEVTDYEAYRNVHGFLARKRGARPS